MTKQIITFLALVIVAFTRINLKQVYTGRQISPEIEHNITNVITNAFSNDTDQLDNAMQISQQLSNIYDGFWTVLINIRDNQQKAFLTFSINYSWWAIYDQEYFNFAPDFHYYLARFQKKDNEPASIKSSPISKGFGITQEMFAIIISSLQYTNILSDPIIRAYALQSKLRQKLLQPGIYWSVYTANNRNFSAYIGCYKDMWITDDRLLGPNHHTTLIWAVSI